MALITIPTKSTGNQMGASELNQILNALKDGTLEINTAGIQIAGDTLSAEILKTEAARGGQLLIRNSSGVIEDADSLNGDPNIADPLTFNNIPTIVKKTINHDDGGTVKIISLAAGYVVEKVFIEIEEIWNDGSKAFSVGYSADHDAFVTDLGTKLAVAQWVGADPGKTNGVDLWDSTDKYSKNYIATGATDINAYFVGEGSGGTQGICTVYMQIVKLF